MFIEICLDMLVFTGIQVNDISWLQTIELDQTYAILLHTEVDNYPIECELSIMVDPALRSAWS